jgi:hypothetical protein
LPPAAAESKKEKLGTPQTPAGRYPCILFEQEERSWEHPRPRQGGIPASSLNKRREAGNTLDPGREVSLHPLGTREEKLGTSLTSTERYPCTLSFLKLKDLPCFV